tara:strand:- start:6402 stop:6578 length:177 start_codon:yes stop_codon:yes gene_type:complete
MKHRITRNGEVIDEFRNEDEAIEALKDYEVDEWLATGKELEYGIYYDGVHTLYSFLNK